MKTSILISSLAALCLLITFAEAPRRNNDNNMNVALTKDISVITVNRAIMLPGVVITPERKKDAGSIVPVVPAEDFSYLKFDVTEYTEADAVNPGEAEVLPDAIVADYSYLKFNISDYSTSDEITELPVTENNASDISSLEPAVNEFQYLRFDANEYINPTGTETSEIGELPLEEVTTGNQAAITVPVETTSEFGYLKFDVNKYNNGGNLGSDEAFELPVK